MLTIKAFVVCIFGVAWFPPISSNILMIKRRSGLNPEAELIGMNICDLIGCLGIIEFSMILNE